MNAHIMRATAALLILGGFYAQAAPALTRADREAAVNDTIDNDTDCSHKSFYWEIGNAGGRLAHGDNQYISQPPERDEAMQIASASKWIYAPYMAQKRVGQLTSDDIQALTNTTGYTEADRCDLFQNTVGDCLNGNISPDPEYAGDFVYVPTNDQWHASNVLNLASKNAEGLATEMLGVLNLGLPNDQKITFEFGDPAPAYGITIDTENYARFLQNILNGYLQIRNLLGTNAVLADCPHGDLNCTASNSPVAKQIGEEWHYSIGHWVEDDADGADPNDPNDGQVYNDGAFSSPGAYGYYPWITADKSYYGIVARRSGLLFEPQAAANSVRCGRKIRKAWATGTQQ